MDPMSAQQYHANIQQYDPRVYQSGHEYTHAYPAHQHVMLSAPAQAAIPVSWQPGALYAVAPVAHAMQHHMGYNFMEGGVPLPRSSLPPTQHAREYSQQTTRRGPPQKPKRTGYACWVGNIPVTANIRMLKDHFSRGATDDIMSVFLMTSRNCAFVNYLTEEACSNAISRFNQVPLGGNGARLLCRMKRTEPEEGHAGPSRRDSRSSSVPSQHGGSPPEITPEGSMLETNGVLHHSRAPSSSATVVPENHAPPQEGPAPPPESPPSPQGDQASPQEAPAPRPKGKARVQENPFFLQDARALAQNGQALAQEGPASPQEGPAPRPKGKGRAQESPSSLQDEPSPQEGHPPHQEGNPPPQEGQPAPQEGQRAPQVIQPPPQKSLQPPQVTPSPPKERYFVLKSCTKQDLDESYENSTWITQPHVQATLDEAFRSTTDVYLIFSVNRSREYYGYAKMTSSPLDTTTTNGTSQQHPPASPALEGVRITLTPATLTAPAGTIVEDPGRNTIFWETEREAMNAVVATPFRITWCRRRAVSFQQVRGLRNEWNGGKEVKVARDGTELEPAVAKRILQLIHAPMMQEVVGGPAY